MTEQQQPPTSTQAPQVGAATNQGPAHAANANAFAGFSEKSDFNFAVLILWLVAAFAIVASLYFWWLQRGLETTLEEVNKEKSDIVAQLALPSNIKIETDANNFKSSVNALSTAAKQRVSVSTFLPEFNKKINKDVTLSNLSLATDGTINLTGKTGSYRAIAEQVVALKTLPSITSVDLLSTSVSEDQKEFSFTISAKLVRSTTSSATTNSTSGSAAAPSASTTNQAGGL